MAATATRNGTARRHDTERRTPADVAAERALVGAMLLSREAIGTAITLCPPEAFYRPAHSHLAAAVYAMFSAGEAVDPITLAARLTTAGTLDMVGGPAGITEVLADGVVASNARRYATIVADLWRLRRLIAAATEIADHAYSAPESVDGALALALDKVLAVSGETTTVTSGPRPLGDWMAEKLDQLERAAAGDSDAVPVVYPTGLLDLDDQLGGGIRPGELVTVAGVPGSGKTVLATQIAQHIATVTGTHVVEFEMEMSGGELTERIIASTARVDLGRVRDARQLTERDWERISLSMTAMPVGNLWIDEDYAPSVSQIRARVMQMRSRGVQVGVVVIDYVQLFALGAGAGENIPQLLNQVSQQLKNLARDLEVAVLLVAQVNGDMESRADKRPTVGDLYGSGGMRRASDVILLLYRDELYNPDGDQVGIVEVIVGKQRNGPTSRVRCAYLGQYGIIANMARSG